MQTKNRGGKHQNNMEIYEYALLVTERCLSFCSFFRAILTFLFFFFFVCMKKKKKKKKPFFPVWILDRMGIYNYRMK